MRFSGSLSPFELVECFRPVVLQELRERAVGQEPAPCLTRGTIVDFVLAVHDALNGLTAARARLPEAAGHSHPFAERSDLLGKIFTRLILKTRRPFGEVRHYCVMEDRDFW